jgi:membrane-associated phospholipid phosphatase
VVTHLSSRRTLVCVVPLLVDLIAACAAGLLALLGARWYAQSPHTPERPTEEVARTVGEEVRQHSGLRRLVVRRLDRSVTTGLLLTLALALTLLGGLVLGVLALLVRRVAAIQHVDNSVAVWGHDHGSSWSTSGLKAITELGSIQIIVGLAVALVVVDAFRRRNRWSFLFLITVMAGMEASMLGVKDIVGRVRPTLNPAAATLGPSFPSGHSATAAAFYAAAALIIGRTLQRSARQFVIAGAIGVAVAVAASRVLLDLHWLSDVVGGLALGWAWFALCAVVFGGRLLMPTAAADLTAAHADSPDSEPTAAHTRSHRNRTAA